MFVSYMGVDNKGEPLQRLVNISNIDAINCHLIEFSSNQDAEITAEQYDEIIQQLDELGLIYKPSINTKGMFIELVYGDTTEFLAVDAIALVEKLHDDDFDYAVVLKTGHIKKISKKLYDQIYVVLHKPNELTKGRTD